MFFNNPKLAPPAVLYVDDEEAVAEVKKQLEEVIKIMQQLHQDRGMIFNINIGSGPYALAQFDVFKRITKNAPPAAVN
jgi:hypothetical protein